MADLTISGLLALLDADPDIHSLMVGDGLLRELLDAETALHQQETALAFETTCTGCGQALTAAHDAEVRADAAEKRAAELNECWEEAENRAADRLELLDQLRRDLDRERRWKNRFKERVAALEAAAADTADSTTPVVTDAMVRDALVAADRAGGFAHDADRGERVALVRAAIEAALAVGPWRTGTPPEATP